MPLKPQVWIGGSAIEFSLPDEIDSGSMWITIVGPDDQPVFDSTLETPRFSWVPTPDSTPGDYRYEVRAVDTANRSSSRGRERFAAGTFSWREGRLTSKTDAEPVSGPVQLASPGGELTTLDSPVRSEGPTPKFVFWDTDSLGNCPFELVQDGVPGELEIRHFGIEVVDLETDCELDVRDSITVNATGDVGLSDSTLFVDRSSGRVGIGTTMASQELHVVSGDGGDILLSGSQHGESWAVGIFSGDGSFIVSDATTNSNAIRIEKGVPNQTLHLDSMGRVGIGTANPGQDLHVFSSDGGDIKLSGGAGNGEWDLGIFAASGDFGINDPSTAGNELIIRKGAPANSVVMSTSGVGIGELNPTAMLHVAGSGRIDGDVALGSSRTLKTGFGSVSPTELLAKVADLPVASWRYKSEDEEKVHIGPFAEDFQRLFGLGDGETISVIDAQGVTLAAIQGLQQELAEKDVEIAQQNQRIEELTARLAALEAGSIEGKGEQQ